MAKFADLNKAGIYTLESLEPVYERMLNMLDHVWYSGTIQLGRMGVGTYLYGDVNYEAIGQSAADKILRLFNKDVKDAYLHLSIDLAMEAKCVQYEEGVPIDKLKNFTIGKWPPAS